MEYEKLPSFCTLNVKDKNAPNTIKKHVTVKEKNNFEKRGRSKSMMEYCPINKSTTEVPFKNVFDIINAITKPSTDLHNDSHVVIDDDEFVEEFF